MHALTSVLVISFYLGLRTSGAPVARPFEAEEGLWPLEGHPEGAGPAYQVDGVPAFEPDIELLPQGETAPDINRPEDQPIYNTIPEGEPPEGPPRPADPIYATIPEGAPPGPGGAPPELPPRPSVPEAAPPPLPPRKPKFSKIWKKKSAKAIKELWLNGSPASRKAMEADSPVQGIWPLLSPKEGATLFMENPQSEQWLKLSLEQRKPLFERLRRGKSPEQIKQDWLSRTPEDRRANLAISKVTSQEIWETFTAEERLQLVLENPNPSKWKSLSRGQKEQLWAIQPKTLTKKEKGQLMAILLDGHPNSVLVN